jgi:hypothetical protein
VIIFILLVLMVQGWYYWQVDKITATNAQNSRDRDLARLVAEQQANNQRLGYADDSRELAAIPIDLAMDLWIAEHGTPIAVNQNAPETERPDAASGGADPVTPVLDGAATPDTE